MLGVALPQLEILNGRMVLDVSLLKDPPADDLLLKAPLLRGHRNPSTTPLFPRLKVLEVHALRLPACGAMEENFYRPDYFEGDLNALIWGFYLARLSELMIPYLLQQMPALTSFYIDRDDPIEEEHDQVEMDEYWYQMWLSCFSQMVNETL